MLKDIDFCYLFMYIEEKETLETVAPQRFCSFWESCEM